MSAKPFRRKGSPYYYVRVRVNGRQILRSTGESDLREAKVKAAAIYADAIADRRPRDCGLTLSDLFGLNVERAMQDSNLRPLAPEAIARHLCVCNHCAPVMLRHIARHADLYGSAGVWYHRVVSAVKDDAG